MSSISVYITASAANPDLEDQIIKHLAQFEMQGLLQLFFRRRISPGIDVSNDLATKIEQSDVALLLLSKDFLCDTDVINAQFPLILAREAIGLIRIVPVLMRPCLWDAHPNLRKRQIYPLSRRPLSALTQTLRDEAFIAIVKGLVPIQYAEDRREVFHENATFRNFLKEACLLRDSLSQTRQLLHVPKFITDSMISMFVGREKRSASRQITNLALEGIGTVAEKKSANQVRKFVDRFLNDLNRISLYDKEKLEHFSIDQVGALLYKNLEHSNLHTQLDGIVGTLRSLQDCEVYPPKGASIPVEGM